ncbi:MAG: T9SS type A sorting domain-containing protein [Saprospiraceae bacterium]|nr:T9SS type A sorting domain-containing protein [Lewinella sp.]
MSKLFSLLVFCCGISACLSAQVPAPGGVKGIRLWLVSETNERNEVIWKDRISKQIIALPGSAVPEINTPSINFNPSYLFGTTAGVAFTPPDLQLNRATIFSLYQNRDTITEKSIWSFDRNGHTAELLTTHRLADLERIEYINFSDPNSLAPRINTFLQNQETPASGPLSIRFGHTPPDYQLPISAYSGLFPEFIAYDRVLDPEERQRVESYLAIKYGIMLDPSLGANYLNSQGTTVFSPEESGSFIHRITGIGRDDQSGLYQKQSTSSYDPGLLTISLGTQATDNSSNAHTLPDENFLVWADNDKPLDRADKPPLNPVSLERQWLVEATGQWDKLDTEIQLNTRQLREPATIGETYWLLVDRSGQGDFSGKNALDIYPLSQLLPEGQAVFQSIHWDTDGSGRDVFSLATGPELIARARLESPLCQPERPGSLRISALGGRAPYTYELRSNSQLLSHWTRTDQSEIAVNDLSAGEYELIITDADRREFRETFFFQSADAPQIDLASHYHLNTDGTLYLDAANSASPNADYRWKIPDGNVRNGSALQITQAGTYELEVSDQGCLAKKQIIIEAPPMGNFRKVELFPNPTSTGNFELRVHMEQPAALKIRIFDVAGRPILQQQLIGDSYHHTSGRLQVKGTYLIQLQSGTDQFSLPLIVQ